LNPLLYQFASTEPASGGIFEALGIDWQLLILQIVAFLILVLLLRKFVYPWLMKSVDERRDNIEAAGKAATAAQAAAVDAEARVAKLLKQARVEAADIVATAKLESAAALTASEDKAKKRADQIVSDAKSDIDKQVLAAKTALHNEAIELVIAATEKVVGKTVTASIDASLIADSVKAAK
jgi:F-type H+-transporting ATPase subunit b